MLAVSANHSLTRKPTNSAKAEHRKETNIHEYIQVKIDQQLIAKEEETFRSRWKEVYVLRQFDLT